MVSGFKTLLKLILAEIKTTDTSLSDLDTEVKLTNIKLDDLKEELQTELQIMNLHLSIVTGDKIVEDDIE